MDDIILRKNEKNYGEVFLSPEAIEKIQQIEKAMNCYNALSPVKAQMMQYDFLKHINELSEKLKNNLNLFLKENSPYDKDYIDKLNSIKSEYEKINQIKGRIRNSDPTIWNNIINLTIECYETIKKMTLLKAYKDIKDNVFDNIKSLSETVITNDEKNLIYESYEQALDQKDFTKLAQIIEEVNKKVLLDWQKIGSNLSSMTDDNFCFLGHSTTVTNHFEKFNTPLMSTSLYNQDINDTYRGRYGFIMSPQNIVAADAEDLYVDNNAENKETMFMTTDVATIDSPSRMINANRKLMQANLAEYIKKPVYNEVDIDVSKSFQPLGVFCFTTGALEYDFDLIKAKELAKNNNLPLYTFDVLARKQGAVLESLQLQILNNIRRKNWHSSDFFYELEPAILKRYQYFFTMFAKLKATKSYTAEQIKSIFDKNVSLINNKISGNEIFSGKYSDEEITTILKFNFDYNIDDMINNKLYTYTGLKFLASELQPYIKELDKYYPDLSKFIFVLSKMEITEEIVESLKSASTTNMLGLTKILAIKLKKDLETNQEKKSGFLEGLENEYQALQGEAKMRTKMQTDYENAKKLSQGSWRLDYERRELEDLQVKLGNIDQEITLQTSKKASLETEKIGLKSSIEELSNNLENIVTSSDKPLEELQRLAEKLQRHPYLNFFKLKKLRKEIKALKSAKDLEVQSKKLELENKITALKKQIAQLDNKLASLIESINKLEQTKCEIKMKIADKENLIKSKYGSVDL